MTPLYLLLRVLTYTSNSRYIWNSRSTSPCHYIASISAFLLMNSNIIFLLSSMMLQTSSANDRDIKPMPSKSSVTSVASSLIQARNSDFFSITSSFSRFYITNRYYSCLPGSAGVLARHHCGRGRPRSQSWLQRYDFFLIPHRLLQNSCNHVHRLPFSKSPDIIDGNIYQTRPCFQCCPSYMWS